jgi:hypothetical protein
MFLAFLLFFKINLKYEIIGMFIYKFYFQIIFLYLVIDLIQYNHNENNKGIILKV